jgi:hypothetical protein
MDPVDVRRSVLIEAAKSGRFGLSVACGSGTLAQLAAQARMPHKRVRVSTVRQVRRAGFDVVADALPASRRMPLSCSVKGPRTARLRGSSPCLRSRLRTPSPVIPMSELPVVFADFAAPGPGGVLYSLRQFADAAALAVARRVRLEDSEGNTCQARVVELREDLIVLEPDWETWVPAEDAAAVTGPKPKPDRSRSPRRTPA